MGGAQGPGGQTGSGKLLGSNAPSTGSMEANIRRMNAANAKNANSGGKDLPKMGMLTLKNIFLFY